MMQHPGFALSISDLASDRKRFRIMEEGLLVLSLLPVHVAGRGQRIAFELPLVGLAGDDDRILQTSQGLIVPAKGPQGDPDTV